MTNKDQSKYPYDRSEDVTLTTEPQIVDWAGLYKIRDKSSGKILDKLNAWLYANDPRKAGDNPKQETPPIDVEEITGIAWEVFFSSNKPAPYNQMKDVISHLASAGYLRTSLPRIEGLEEALACLDDDSPQYTYNLIVQFKEKYKCMPNVKFQEAARACLKHMED